MRQVDYSPGGGRDLEGWGTSPAGLGSRWDSRGTPAGLSSGTGEQVGLDWRDSPAGLGSGTGEQVGLEWRD